MIEKIPRTEAAVDFASLTDAVARELATESSESLSQEMTQSEPSAGGLSNE